MIRKYLLGLFLLSGGQAYAVEYFFSATLDNDLFVGEDSGYTNGIYFSLYDVYGQGDPLKKPSIWVWPLMWSMPSGSTYGIVNVNSLGQVLTTAEDISQVNPPEGSLPYSGLLNYTNAYIKIGSNYADWVSTSVGLVGPKAKGEQTQKAVHKAIGAKEPKGWDTQLKNEVVFGFSRGRALRVLASSSDTFDVVAGGQIAVGTLRSGANAGFMLRVGQNLQESYSTVLLANARASNPIAVNNGWFAYAGVLLNYDANSIFTDGNTFRDSRSIDYDHTYNVFTTGLSYSLGGHGAITFAYNTSFNKRDEVDTNNSIQTEKLNRYGTLTIAWQL
ncbi:lipid A deacylase LpxR family protein [Marinomonas transparens]|uniref:Lipid A deacylase LpxR family protein n=1 Tax=Marinomonas transparens TaxID=2795388 RepID=A0A934JSF3_9GAMM|nr:lipid A deacylase LpxR family protein [Marinomonas transparens]MBJ7539159.1 lipid A deacylase LpxR family protein [Marinomonas transparens]